ncbi:hypothetical protein TeGR_g10274 [Tetraparma gracilis]|uniref:Uncharacterized protein n=1 Tax=Tetraparma gracilis TaxID=2962635 RepID=A0ABQ6M5F6_9STRA|nr:hypothetical protein TeGR_g10274 [Tetraparma gracilis]
MSSSAVSTSLVYAGQTAASSLQSAANLTAPLLQEGARTAVRTAKFVHETVKDHLSEPPDRRPAELVDRIEAEQGVPPESQTPTVPWEHFGSAEKERAGVQLFFLMQSYYGYPVRALDGGKSLPPPSRSHNFLQYAYNNHPLLALFLQHPLHPFTPASRAAHLYITVGFTLLLTAVMSEGLEVCTKFCDAGCDDISHNYTDPLCSADVSGTDSGGCCVGNSVDIDYPEWLVELAPVEAGNTGEWMPVLLYDEFCSYVKYNGLLSVLVITCAASPFDSLVRCLASGCRCQGRRLAAAARRTGRGLVAVLVFAATAWWAIALVLALGFPAGKATAARFATAQLLSWGTWFPQGWAWFVLYYGSHRKEFRKMYPGLDFVEVEGWRGGGAGGAGAGGAGEAEGGAGGAGEGAGGAAEGGGAPEE